MSWRDYITYLDPEAEDITEQMMDDLEGTRVKIGDRMLTFDEAWQAIRDGVEVSRSEFRAMPYAYEVFLSVRYSIENHGKPGHEGYTVDEVRAMLANRYQEDKIA